MATEKKPADDAVSVEPVVDHVQMVSLRADGTPDQTPGHVVIGDEQT